MVAALVWLTGCGWFGGPEPDPGLDAETIARYIPSSVAERQRWAVDIRRALVASDLPVDEDHVCQVIAIIEQESTYRADPSVPDLGGIARAQIEEKVALLGPLADLGIDWLLSPVADGASRSFEERLAAVRTEGQLDELYQDLVDHHTRHASGVPLAGTLIARELDKLNPIDSSGSMQVSVEWAQDAARREGIPRATVRALLYTREGGLRWGTARLFAVDADYDDPIYRFADYNAGVFASRNAAFQAALSELIDIELALDGDLLAYDREGRASDGETMGALLAWRALHAPDLSEGRVRRDVRREKTRAFESTATWERLRAHFASENGEPPPYARLPDVRLSSPKLSRPRTTAWFAENVDRRYTDCRSRHDPRPSDPEANANTSAPVD